MAFDATKSDLTLAVIGTGTMGRGIVQVSAAGGMNVIAYDERPGGAAAAKEFIGKMLDRSVEKGQMPADQAKAALDRITVATSLAECARADVIIEAVFERLDIKQDLFEKLDAVAPHRPSSHRTPRRWRSPRSQRAPNILSAALACTSSIPCR